MVSTAALAVTCNALAARATVAAGSSPYPSYNLHPAAPNSSGMTRTAVEVAAKIKLGWNAGNTMEAVGGETGWGNPEISQKLINRVKELGFDAVRLPCAWDQYSDQKTAKISDKWLNRVKEVVQYCINADLYVLLNIHWDGGWLENHIDAEHKDGITAKQRAFWEQIATHLRDFDERLMFASANEPDAKKPDQVDMLLSFHQTFVDTVRATGAQRLGDALDEIHHQPGAGQWCAALPVGCGRLHRPADSGDQGSGKSRRFAGSGRQEIAFAALPPID
jgi:hypothetical protein